MSDRFRIRYTLPTAKSRMVGAQENIDHANARSSHDDDDKGGDDGIMQTEHIPQKFHPQTFLSNVYVKPEQGQFVSHIWNKEPVDYRVGLLVSDSGCGRLRFYQGDKAATLEDAAKDPDYDPPMEFNFHLTKVKFEQGYFRIRSDLQIGTLCYDWNEKRPYRLLGISSEKGAVQVESLDGAEKYWISPDDLVGGYRPSIREEPHKRPRLNVPNENETLNKYIGSGDIDQTETKSPKSSRDIPKYDYCVGILRSSETIYPACWYVRGKLRAERLDDGTFGEAELFEGESVRYCPTSGRCLQRQLLQWSPRWNKYLQVTSRNDKEKIWNFAWQAELKHAAKIREEQEKGQRQERLAGLKWRPLQPVYVISKGPAILVEAPPDEEGFWKVVHPQSESTYHKSLMKIDLKRAVETMTARQNVRLLGHENEPIDIEAFFRREEINMLPQKPSYRAQPDHLQQLWRVANKDFRKLEREFEDKSRERRKRRLMAMGEEVACNTSIPRFAVERLDRRAAQLLSRLQEDFSAQPADSIMEFYDFKQRIVEIKNLRTRPNMLLLCGGFAPEVVAYKRLEAAPLGTVIIQDTDIAAVGVAVAAHPDVDFAIVGCPVGKFEVGDVRIMRDRDIAREVEIKVGGIDSTGITNPCQSFSLAGRKEGFLAEAGKLFHDCVAVQLKLAASSDTPFYLAENVLSTKETNEDYNAYLPDQGAQCFHVCASICTPSCRVRKYATNRPPPICPESPTKGRPPCLNGDLKEYQAASIVSQNGSRFVHRKLKKLPCLMNSNPARKPVVWEMQQNQEPEVSQVLPEEAERAMGYRDDEIGITAFTAEAAIRNRIARHNYSRDGRLISLKGCASDSEFPLAQVDDIRRLALLGNSQAVTLLEAFLWPESELYPPFDPIEDEPP